MKIKFMSIVAAVAAMMAVGCSSDDPDNGNGNGNGNENNDGNESVVPAPEEEVVYASLTDEEINPKATEFAWPLLNNAKANSDGNTLVSPVSAFVALSMLQNGGDNATRAQLAHALGFEEGVNCSDINRYNQNLVAQLVSTKATVALANKMWLRPCFTVNSDFENALADNYDCAIDPLDLATIQSEINAWCNEKTFGLIPYFDINVTDDLTHVLANATYYKNAWQELHNFAESATRKEFFTFADGTEKRIDMMHKSLTALLAADDLCQVVIEHMGDDRAYSFFSVLPNEGVGVDECAEHLASGAWNRLLEAAQWKLVRLQLPKFEVETEGSLISALESMGFDADVASFDRIFAEAKLMDVRQKAKFIVNEYGVEAAAVTLLGGAGSPGGSFEPVEHYLNRPFIYGIKHEATGAILFLGKMCAVKQVASKPNTDSDSKQ